ncbi:MAG: hypothetical protein HY550_00615 [Elusimicrobia bacterium]|nr:hypothetical protein [Elusimicrobiota bacterium]
MKKTLFLAALAACCLAACKKKAPERVPVPKAGPPEKTAVLPSTAPASGRNPLKAPGDYLKTTVGHVKEAREAKALFESTARDGLNRTDLNDTGGN